MGEGSDGLGKRLGDTIRHAAAIQAKAYQDYGELLARYARRDISTIDLGRNSADIYVGAAGAIASAAVNLGRQTLEGGASGLKAAARDAEKAVEEMAPAGSPAKAKAAAPKTKAAPAKAKAKAAARKTKAAPAKAMTAAPKTKAAG